MKKIQILLTGLIFSLVSFAQAPESFTYQAIVRDNLGQPLPNTTVTFQFNILQTSVSGTVVYSEEQTTTTNDYGLVNLNIGQGTVQSGTFSTIDWSSDAYFLNVQLDLGSGFVDLGTQQFISVPYALYSKSSGNSGITNAAGNNGDVQFNDNGSLGANPDLHWDETTKKFIVGQSTDDGRMIIQQDASAPDTIPILEVKNKLGQTIFVVYPDSVHIYINDDNSKGVLKGGFAVSGRSGTKAVTDDFLVVRPDSTRIWTKDSVAGFGIRDLSSGSSMSYMHINSDNSFIGQNAGLSNTLGLYNCFLGFESGMMNTTGYYNVNLGYWAGRNSVTGSSNTYIGFSSGWNSDGQNNIGIGVNALGNSNVGTDNTAIGNSALAYNDGGNYNVAIGNNALSFNTQGNRNVAVGRDALRTNTDGGYNVAIGEQTLEHNTTGRYNVAMGWSSGSSNDDGEYNIYVGRSAGDNNNSGDENICIGHYAAYDLDGGTNNVAVGYYAGRYLEGGDGNVFLGYNARCSSLSTISNSMALGYNTTVSVSNRIAVGNTSVTWIGGQVTWSTYSDARVKNNITDDVKGLDFILKLKPVTYNFDKDKLDKLSGTEDKSDYPEKYDIENIKQSGFLAQDVEKAAEESGYDFSGVHKPSGDTKYYSLSYSEFVVPLVKAVQELNEKVDALEKENKELKELINKSK